MNKNITDNILEQIKDTKPTSRFAFLARNYAFWVGAVLSVAVGAVTVAVMIFVVRSQTWEFVEHAGGPGKALLYILPYFWLIVFVLFVILTWYAVRHVDGGYRFALPIIMVAYFVVSILLGIGLYAAGVGDRVDRGFVEHAPLYERMVAPRHQLWHQPARGLLLGRVLEIEDINMLILDIDRTEWHVSIDDADLPDREIMRGMIVQILGEIEDSGAEQPYSCDAKRIEIHKMPMKKMPQHIQGIKMKMKEMR